ncbi:MAG: hypothetical protein WCA12_14705, partial [Burkholderiales bacterium]
SDAGKMFSDRDRARGARPPSEDLLPWSGEFAGKYLIAGAQFVRLTGDSGLRAHFGRFVRDLIDSQGTDGYLGPFEFRARMIGKPESKVWSNFFPAGDRPTEWNGWVPVGDNVFPAGSTVTALSTRENGTSLYVLGFDRKVWTNFFPAADEARWNGWFPLGDNVFPVGSTVTALSTRENGTSLYLLGLDGKVWTNFFPAADGSPRWNGWFPLADNVFPARSTVTALSTVPGGTSLYVLGLDRKVWTNFFPAADGSARWNGWFALADNVFPEGSTVTALSTVPGSTSLYVVGLDQKVWSNFFPAADGVARWEGWFPLGDRKFPERSTASALSTRRGRTSLYVAVFDGNVSTSGRTSFRRPIVHWSGTAGGSWRSRRTSPGCRRRRACEPRRSPGTTRMVKKFKPPEVARVFTARSRRVLGAAGPAMGRKILVLGGRRTRGTAYGLAAYLGLYHRDGGPGTTASQ